MVVTAIYHVSRSMWKFSEDTKTMYTRLTWNQKIPNGEWLNKILLKRNITFEKQVFVQPLNKKF